jgi:hypothetical protein
MFESNSLSTILTERLNEAKILLNLKAEFGRLPNGILKDNSLKRIHDWFNELGENPRGKEPNEMNRPDDLQAVSLVDLEDPALVATLAASERSLILDLDTDDDEVTF